MVLLQGTDWKLNKKSVFVLPPANTRTIRRELYTWSNQKSSRFRVTSYLFGERSEEYNAISDEANKSKHLSFCALDLIPEKTMDRKEFHKKLQETHLKNGKKHNMGLGLYSGLRVHIDT